MHFYLLFIGIFILNYENGVTTFQTFGMRRKKQNTFIISSTQSLYLIFQKKKKKKVKKRKSPFCWESEEVTFL